MSNSQVFPDAINSVTNGFTKKPGIKVNLVVAGTGELLKRIQAESENPLGDVIFGGSSAVPKGLGPILDIKLLNYDFNWASQSKKYILKKWRNIVSGREQDNS